MQTIRLTPDNLRQKASRYENNAQKIQEINVELRQMINSLTTEWEGSAATKFAQQFDELEPHFKSMKELVSMLSVQLNKTAQAYEETDRQIANNFSR